MKKLKHGLDTIIKFLVLLLALGIVLCVVLQILYRYFIDGYLRWSEEVARYLLAWTVFLGMAYGFGHSEHLVVDVLTYKLTGRKAKNVLLIGWITSLVFCAMMLVVSIQGIETISTTNLSTLPSVPYTYVYISLPVGLGLSIIYLVINIIEEFAERRGAAK